MAKKKAKKKLAKRKVAKKTAKKKAKRQGGRKKLKDVSDLWESFAAHSLFVTNNGETVYLVDRSVSFDDEGDRIPISLGDLEYAKDMLTHFAGMLEQVDKWRRT